MPKLITALNALGVPTAAILDFDVLKSKDTLEKIIGSMGKEWDKYEPAWSRLNQEIRTRDTKLKVAQVRTQINGILDDEHTEELTGDAIQRIRDELKSDSLWKLLKNVGLNLVKGGTEANAESLLNDLSEIRVSVVPVGELEDFVSTLATNGTKSSKWVNKVLAEFPDLATNDKLRDAREFVSAVYKRLKITDDPTPPAATLHPGSRE